MSKSNATYITSIPAAHMSTQIRAKQLATKSTQEKLNAAIIKKLQEMQDISGEALTKQIAENLSGWLELVKGVNVLFSPKEELENVGYPIKFNKTALQLEMALKWVAQRDLDIINDLENSVLYNSLSNVNGIDKLPALQAPSDSAFWGNENPSVSSVLLYSIASTLEISIKPDGLMGAATFYPFFKQGYTINGIENNPFVFENGAILFGDYQFGGHRYFSNEYPNLGQRLFSPEDCSSAVGKANHLTERQIVGINTGALRAAYTDPTNEYGYRAITSSSSGEQLNYELIEPGDTYVRGGHTAIVAEKDNLGNIHSLEFNRDIDVAVSKRLGGGTYLHSLPDLPVEPPVYILRSGIPLLKETCLLTDLLGRIDEAYNKFYQDNPVDIAGDCDIFLG